MTQSAAPNSQSTALQSIDLQSVDLNSNSGSFGPFQENPANAQILEEAKKKKINAEHPV